MLQDRTFWCGCRGKKKEKAAWPKEAKAQQSSARSEEPESAARERGSQKEMLQTSFGHISTNSLMILTVSMAAESPWKDLSIDTSHASKQSVLAEILGRSTSNHHGTIY